MSQKHDRRAFLRQAAAGTGALALTACGSSSSGGGADAAIGGDARAGADAAAGSDAAAGIDAGACTPTTPDALGPFFEPGAPMRADIAGPDEPGERLLLSGQVVDDSCAPIPGVLLDVWQADSTGAYHDADAEYRLRGQLLSGDDGRFELRTIRPGHYENGPGAWRPAHIHVTASKPGHAPITTQIYFVGDPYLPPNDGCPSCGSDDPARHVDLVEDGAGGFEGELELILARA